MPIQQKQHGNPQQGHSRQPHLADYYYLLRKRAWLIASILFLTVILTAIFTFTMKPVYQATARILIDRESTRSPLTGEQMESENYISQQLTFRTHFKVITSRPVLEKVIDQIDLEDESLKPGLIGEITSTIKSNLKRLLRTIFQKPEVPSPLSPEDAALAEKVEQLAAKVEIEEVRDTRLLNIRVEDHNPLVARDLANTIANTYILYDSGTRLESSRKMVDWLSKELYGMKKKVEDAEKDLLAFKERENIFSIEGRQKINVQKIEEMNADYLKARSERLVVEARIKELKKFISEGVGKDVRNIPSFLKNDLLETLYTELLNTEVEYRRISGVYRQKHPEMIKVTSKIAELRNKIQQQIQKAMDNVEAERAVLAAREEALQGAISSYESEAIDTNRKEVQYSILDREVQTNKELYKTLLTKVKEANVTDEVTKTNLRLVEPASAPLKPVRPKKALNLILSIVLGLFTGVGLAFFLEYLDQTVHNKEEVDRYLQLPVLAEVPIQKNNRGKGKSSAHSVPLLLDLPPNSHFSESMRRLATNLRFSELNQSRGVYLITSSTPREGKSTVSLNLSLAMAQRGVKTLLLEADLRLPTMKRILDLPEKIGLTDILVDIFGTEITAGSLDQWSVNDVHKLLEVQEKTGLLSYRNQAHQYTVSFLKGRIIDVDWPTRPPENRLDALLVKSGKISQEQAQIALQKQQSSSQRFGQVLLQLGFLSVDDLAGPLELHIRENLEELYRCTHADFTFRPFPPHVSSEFDSKEAALIATFSGLNHDAAHAMPFLLGEIRRRLFQVSDTGLWVLPCGRVTPRPAELLASSRMRILLELLRQEFDLILIDSPPISTVSDAAVLAPMSDGVMLLIRTGATHVKEIQRAKDQLNAVQATIVGTVLNMLDFKRDPYYYGRYYYKYRDYYGKEV